MALSSMQSNQVGAGLKTRRWIHSLTNVAKTFVSNQSNRHGLAGVLLACMVVASCLKLLWSHSFPWPWWVVLVLLLAYQLLYDKFVWPRELWLTGRQDADRERAEKKRKEDDSAGN